MFCGACGTKRVPEQKFCGNCGHKFSVTLESAPEVEKKQTISPKPSEPTVETPIKVSLTSVPSTKVSSSSSWLMSGLLLLGFASAVVAGYYVVQENSLLSGDSSESTGVFSSFSSSSDIDTPKSYPYGTTEVSCSKGLIGTARGIAFDLDRQIRSGESSISLKEEEELGKRVLDKVEEEMSGRLVQDSREAKYIASIGKELARHAQRKEITFTFYMMEGTEVENAFALPGGYVVITRPLFDVWVDNEAQLATVIGHEIVHIDQKHTTAMYEYAKKILKTSQDDQIALFIAQQLTSIAYSTEREAESDELGAELIHKSGYSTFQSVRVWEKVAERNPSRQSRESSDDIFSTVLNEGLKEVENVFASHPDPEYRACNLKKKTYQLYQENHIKKPYVGAKNYQKRIPKQEKEF